MPRLPTALLRRAYALDPHLPALLSPCRDLRTAQNELRWLREHVDAIAKARRAKGTVLSKPALLKDLVQQRARGKPLQYILGTEWFGDLEMRCREGVLIPRQDTAASVSHLVRLLRGAEGLPAELRVLDLCTGTGCIPLLFAHEFYTNTDQECETDLRVLGVDVSSKALKLAEHNLKRTTRTSLKETPPKQKANINFLSADILCDPFADQVPGSPRPLKSALNLSRHPRFWDILISNPPYISPKEYWKTTTRSVRGYEPKLALVPQPHAGLDDVGQGDMFYAPLLDIAADIEAKIVLLEVADLAQALRVARQAQDTGWFDGVEIWRDQPDTVEQASDEKTAAEPQEFPIVGQGNARTVLCYRGPGTQWLQKQPLRPPLAAHASSPTAQSHSLEPTFDFQPVKGAQGRYRVNWSP